METETERERRRLTSFEFTSATKKHQERLWDWALHAIPNFEKQSVQIGAMRFLEEATELCQSLGLDAEQVRTVADYVYSRPVGKVSQEVGDVMTTLGLLCQKVGLNYGSEAVVELFRLNDPAVIQKCGEKELLKRAAGLTAGAPRLKIPAMLHNQQTFQVDARMVTSSECVCDTATEMYTSFVTSHFEPYDASGHPRFWVTVNKEDYDRFCDHVNDVTVDGQQYFDQVFVADKCECRDCRKSTNKEEIN